MPRGRADNPDAELFELIKEVKSSSRRFQQVWARLKGVRGAERSDALDWLEPAKPKRRPAGRKRAA